jgi:hypothetical protein
MESFRGWIVSLHCLALVLLYYCCWLHLARNLFRFTDGVDSPMKGVLTPYFTTESNFKSRFQIPSPTRNLNNHQVITKRKVKHLDLTNNAFTWSRNTPRAHLYVAAIEASTRQCSTTDRKRSCSKKRCVHHVG